jgi:hypothetical protein
MIPTPNNLYLLDARDNKLIFNLCFVLQINIIIRGPINIKDVLPRDWRVRISHTLREGNVCADYLAKYGAHHNEAFTTIASPPAGINLLLLAYASGTWFLR